MGCLPPPINWGKSDFVNIHRTFDHESGWSHRVGHESGWAYRTKVPFFRHAQNHISVREAILSHPLWLTIFVGGINHQSMGGLWHCLINMIYCFKSPAYPHCIPPAPPAARIRWLLDATAGPQDLGKVELLWIKPWWFIEFIAFLRRCEITSLTNLVTLVRHAAASPKNTKTHRQKCGDNPSSSSQWCLVILHLQLQNHRSGPHYFWKYIIKLLHSWLHPLLQNHIIIFSDTS